MVTISMGTWLHIAIEAINNRTLMMVSMMELNLLQQSRACLWDNQILGSVYDHFDGQKIYKIHHIELAINLPSGFI